MSIKEILVKVNYSIFNPLILLLVTLAFVYFAYGVIRFLSIDANDKGNSRQEARDAIMWGIIGMAIMFSVYGLIGFVLRAFGVTSLPTTVGEVSNIKI